MQPRLALFVAALVALAAAYLLYGHPPLAGIARGEVAMRVNRLTGEASEWGEGVVLVLPGLHELRVFSLREQMYRPEASAVADGPPPLSADGLSLGVDVSVRYALDAARLPALWRRLPEDVSADLVQPAVASVVSNVLARHTVQDIFSARRDEIQRAIERELGERLAPEGVALRGVRIVGIELLPDCPRLMEVMLAELLACERRRLGVGSWI